LAGGVLVGSGLRTVTLVAFANAVGDLVHRVVPWVRNTDAASLAVDIGGIAGLEAGLLGRRRVSRSSDAGSRSGRALGNGKADEGDENGEELHCC